MNTTLEVMSRFREYLDERKFRLGYYPDDDDMSPFVISWATLDLEIDNFVEEALSA